MRVIANGGATPNTGAGDSARDGAAKINAWAGGAVLDKDLTAPPGSPSTGDAYIVAATATGAWEGKEDQIALYHDSRWWFIVPGANDRPTVHVIDEDRPYRWNGSTWSAYTLDHGALTGIPQAPTYTVSGAPSAASAGAGAIIHVSDDVDGAVLAFSDGADWRRVTDRAVISDS